MKSAILHLRDYQQSSVRRVIEAWTCRRSVLVQMPTGTGKTRVLAAIVGEELEAGGAAGRRRVDYRPQARACRADKRGGEAVSGRTANKGLFGSVAGKTP